MAEENKPPKHVSVKRVAGKAITAERKLKEGIAKQAAKDGTVVSMDSFVNFAQKLGVGADNPTSTAGYGFNPVTRIRTMLEWIHRGSWLGGVAVDVVADDMTRAGVELKGELTPDEIDAIEEMATTYDVWGGINETIKWSRLYGGCIAVMMIDGQDFSTPLRLETIGKDGFQGLLVLDRWMIEPSLNNLITQPGPELGLPKFYTVTADAPALPRIKIHHTRCIRLVGIKLPYWQRVTENLWGISVLERLYDRMIAYDSATTGVAQLVYKAYIRTYKIKGMREIVAAGGVALNGLVAYVDMMRRFQGVEGVTLMDGEDEFEHTEHGAFTGLVDVLTSLGEQISGALQIPLVRLFGQSPAGFSNGDADLRMYYDGIYQQQEQQLLVGVTKIYRAIAASKQIKLPPGFKIVFKSLWQQTETEKSDILKKKTDAIVSAYDIGLISAKVGMQELKQLSDITGVFSNITSEDINKAEDELPPNALEMMEATAKVTAESKTDTDESEGDGKNKPVANGAEVKTGETKS